MMNYLIARGLGIGFLGGGAVVATFTPIFDNPENVIGYTISLSIAGLAAYVGSYIAEMNHTLKRRQSESPKLEDKID